MNKTLAAFAFISSLFTALTPSSVSAHGTDGNGHRHASQRPAYSEVCHNHSWAEHCHVFREGRGRYTLGAIRDHHHQGIHRRAATDLHGHRVAPRRHSNWRAQKRHHQHSHATPEVNRRSRAVSVVPQRQATRPAVRVATPPQRTDRRRSNASRQAATVVRPARTVVVAPVVRPDSQPYRAYEDGNEH
jgi:hypothetical protein